MRYPKAVWKGPVPNESSGGMRAPILGLVLHIEQGAEDSANNWFHNPGAQASAHFGNPKSGPIQQWVDTADMAWAEVNGNPRWYSVEHEGFSGEALTASQVENDAQLYAWLHSNYAVPLVVSDDPNKAGLGWHGMGGASWGGHYNCPGDPIKSQRAAILARAEVILHPPIPPAVGTPTQAELDVSNLTLLRSKGRQRKAIAAGYHLWYYSENRFVVQFNGVPKVKNIYVNKNALK